jgi:hypothetical protein
MEAAAHGLGRVRWCLENQCITVYDHVSFNYRMSHATVQRLWPDLSPPPLEQLPLLDYHSYPERSQARLEVVQLYFQGWSKTSISRFLHVSRPTINEWIRRFEAEDLASLDVEDLASLDANDLKSLADGSHAPKTPRRKVWLPVMLEVYHLQKRHPDAGRFRIWSLLGKPEIGERTVGRLMALNKRLYPDSPHVVKKGGRKRPGRILLKPRWPTSTGSLTAA